MPEPAMPAMAVAAAWTCWALYSPSRLALILPMFQLMKL